MLLSLAAGFSDLRPALFAVAAGVLMAAIVAVVVTVRRSRTPQGMRRHG